MTGHAPTDTPPRPATPRRLFVIGANRSGTTWLQLLLAQHPRVATTQEPLLFGAYLAPLDRKWAHQSARREDERKTGLPAVLSREQFVGALRHVSDAVFDAIQRARPDADVLLYKGVGTEAPFVHEVHPDAWFVHIVRDPRSVAASTRAASRGFGRRWAPASLAAAAETWVETVRACRSLRERTQRYVEVVYEDLAADTPARLAELLGRLDLPAAPEFAQRAAEACSFEVMKSGTYAGAKAWDVANEPKDFFRRGAAEGWRSELSPQEAAVVEHVAGDLLDEFRFERTVPRDALRPAAIARWERRRRAAAAVRRLCEAIATRVEGQRP